MTKISTLDRVKLAFRKLKAHIYFEKTTLPLRDKVVEFESSPDFEEKLQEITEAYDNAGLSNDSPLVTKILSSIALLQFPKKMKVMPDEDENNKNENKDRAVISVGNPEEKPMVSALQYFIDMDVEGHILGVLWIMEFGKQLDDMCFGNSRGNRLRTTLIWDEDTKDIKDSSPALFKPYFAQYSLWRDDGLSCAEDLLNNGHDTLIVMLDLKKFYYSTGITREVFDKIIINDKDKERNIQVHSAVFSIINRYTEVLREKAIKCNEKAIECPGSVLPIGFLPSDVLSNWCLSEFDRGMRDFWNPSYYGRYVDDIIIVEKVEKGSTVYDKARKNELTKEYVIDYYLGSGRHRDARYFAKKPSVPESSSVVATSDELPMNNDKGKLDDSYEINKAFCLSDKSLFAFQSSKIRIIALFADNNSIALINKFKKEIHENVSVFRFMPEIDGAFPLNDFSRFYRLDNNATINKLRGIEKITIDRYELSKFLGQYRIVSSLIDDEDVKKFTRIIEKMFNNRELIEDYTLWERIFEIFITNKDYVGFSRFAKRVKRAIDMLVADEKCAEKKCIDIEVTQNSLRRHLSATFNRVLSLIWGKEADKVMQEINETTLLRRAYINTRMSNKYVVPVPIEIIPPPSDAIDVNFTDFTDVFQYLRDKPLKDAPEIKFLPYFRQAQDIAMAKFIKFVCANKEYSPCDEYLQEIRQVDKDAPLRFPLDKDIPNSIRVGDKVASKLRIAVANVNVSKVWNLEDALRKRKPKRRDDRYRVLAKLVNDAIKEKADMLVLPENYVPFDWLPALATRAARERLAIITGIEHLIVDKKVYNWTAVILPFKYFKVIPTSAVFFQLKKHYSPEEKRLIEGYGYKAGDANNTEKRLLYSWHDCCFPVYCCYELTDIKDRAEFMSWVDMVVAVEHNKDINYFGSIVESLVRDLHCYCVQVNTSEYGDSRVTQPKRTEERDLLQVKGGINSALLIGEIDFQALREFQIKDYNLQKDGPYKPTPPGISKKIVRKKIERSHDGHQK